MSNVLLVLKYKLKMFFGPSYRGKYGPLPLVVLILAFLPTGLGVGFGIGEYLSTADPDAMVATLGMVLGSMLAMGFVFALGVGVTAHASELDFLMTTPIRPRQYLISDMLFEFASMTLAGGLAMFVAVLGLLEGTERPLWIAAPLILVGMLYGAMILMTVQIITVLKIRYPRGRVRTIALGLLILSLVPLASFVDPSFQESFSAIPIPQASFASIAYDVLFQNPLAVSDVAISAAYLLLIGSAWFVVSGSYIFHGVRPTLSAGLGQIDMGAKMAQQRRLINLFGRSAGTIGLDFRKGGELGLMTRLSLIRIWRDGSFLFLGILVAVFLVIGLGQSSSDDASGFQINMIQAVGWPIAILAINWCFYERENLWIPLVSGRSLITYFKGLLLSFLITGIGIAVLIALVLTQTSMDIDAGTTSFMIGTVIGDSLVATLLLTRIRVKPGAFSPGLIALLLVTFLAGGGVGGAFYSLNMVLESLVPAAVSVMGVCFVAAAVIYLGTRALDAMVRTFKFA